MTILSPAGPVPSTVKVYVRRRRGGKPVNVTLPDEPVSEEDSLSIFKKLHQNYKIHLPSAFTTRTDVASYMPVRITVLQTIVLIQSILTILRSPGGDSAHDRLKRCSNSKVCCNSVPIYSWSTIDPSQLKVILRSCKMDKYYSV